MTEVLIVGGGVFGLSTALSLARGDYRSKPEKILVIGAPDSVHNTSLNPRSVQFTHPSIAQQIDPLAHQKKMLLVPISTRLFDLTILMPYMPPLHSKL